MEHDLIRDMMDEPPVTIDFRTVRVEPKKTEQATKDETKDEMAAWKN